MTTEKSSSLPDNITQLLTQSRDCMGELIDSAFLDASELASDCLEVFSCYEWEPLKGLNDKQLARFNQLLGLGDREEMTNQQLSEFIELVSGDGQVHIYYRRVQARKLVNAISAVL